MDDLDIYIDRRKKNNPNFAENYDDNYNEFKLGELLKQERERAGLTQEQIAVRMNTNKGNISRIEKHSTDIKLSTIQRYIKALGKQIEIIIN